jgi:hypothetical protein
MKAAFVTFFSGLRDIFIKDHHWVHVNKVRSGIGEISNTRW